MAQAQQRVVNAYGVQESGPGRREDAQSAKTLQAITAARKDAREIIERLPTNNEYRKASPERKAEMVREIQAESFAAFGLPPPDAGKTPPPPGAGKALPASKIPTGTTFGKVVPGKGTEVLKDGKVIGYAN
jgi:hypothetical protein